MPPGVFICRRPGPKKICATCRKREAPLLCDGCDKPLCVHCAVSPKREQDFCPSCAKPVFEGWCGLQEGKDWSAVPEGRDPELHRQMRRDAFRAWARVNADAFTNLRDP